MMHDPDPALVRLDGLSDLRDRMATGRRPAMLETMGFDLVEVESGFAAFEGTPDRRFYNPNGSVHGGYAATLLDSACGIAVHTQMSAEQGYTTLELKVSYHRALSDRSGRVRAVGRVISMGRRAAFADAELFDGEGRLCATATSTLLVFEMPPRRAPDTETLTPRPGSQGQR